MRKPSKRKMYQKRRKKERAELRKKSLLPTAKESTDTKSTIHKNISSYHNDKIYQQNRNKKETYINVNHVRNPPVSSITSYSENIQKWWQSYCSAIEFHTRQQISNLDENARMTLFQMYANEYETSSEEEEDPDNEDGVRESVGNVSSENESMDEEYLKFLEVTLKHREELRLKREQEDI